MYLLDWKIPIRLEGVRDTLYEHYVQTTEEPHTLKQKDTMVKAIACFVYNASYNLSGGSETFDVILHPKPYSSDILYNCNRVKRRVSYRATRKFLDWMCEQDLITLSVGSVETWKVDSGGVGPGTCQSSHVVLLEGLLELLEPVSSKQDQEILKSVIELKDDSGNLMSKRLGEGQKRLISLLNTYNTYIKDCSVSIEGVEYFVQCKKVFNGDWCFGGRTYMTGAKVTSELMKRDMRGDIKINGEPTVCWDYSHLHPSIIATKEGVVFEEGYDPYQISLNGHDPTCLRKVCKLALLIMINSKSLRQAVQALSWECGRNLPVLDWQAQGLVPTPLNYKGIISELKDHNPYASTWLFEGRGLELQHADSLIIDEVVSYWNERQTVVLTLYDSVRIVDKHLDELKEVMFNSYESVLGTTSNCKLKLEG